MINVNQAYSNRLCSSCGICKAACPVDAIEYTYDLKGFLKPNVNDKCIECGKCLSVCPGVKYYKKEKKVVDFYVLYSKDEDLRSKAASGGFATEILCFLLKKKIVDYCVVVPQVKNSLVVEPIITDDIPTIRMACGSKYIVVKYDDILLHIKDSEKKYAMVVLPCQEYAIKKMFGNKSENIYFITLMCNHCSGTLATKYLLLKNKEYNEKFTIDYRGDGWPGYMKINGKKISMYREVYNGAFGRFFSNSRCQLCDNHFAYDSLLTLADPYFSSDLGEGSTFCICRDENIKKIIDDMIEENIIGKENISVCYEDIERGYKGIIEKESLISPILKLCKRFNILIPENSNKYVDGYRVNMSDLKKILDIVKDEILSYFFILKTKILEKLTLWKRVK